MALFCLWSALAFPADKIPKEITELLEDAHRAAKIGDPHRSGEIYEGILEKYPTGPVASLTMEQFAAFHLELSQPKKAAKLYQALLKQFPAHPKRLEFLRALGQSQAADKNPVVASETLLEVSKGQANQGKVKEAYQTLGQVDFDTLASVPRDLAFRLCGLSAYLALRQKRFPAALLSLAAQTKWIEKPGYRWMLIQEMQSVLNKMSRNEDLDWVQTPHLRSRIDAELGPEGTLPLIKDPELIALIDTRRKEISKGVKRDVALDPFGNLQDAIKASEAAPKKKKGKPAKVPAANKKGKPKPRY